MYDPATGTWTATGPMNSPRCFFNSMALLFDGTVLAVGQGANNASAELYAPSTGAWSYTGSISQPHADPELTLLLDGSALVVGGGSPGTLNSAAADIYDPDAGAWSATGAMAVARNDAAIVLLLRGSALMTGGTAGTGANFSSTELFSPTTGRWSDAGTMGSGYYHHRAVLLPDNRVLVAGASGATDTYDWLEWDQRQRRLAHGPAAGLVLGTGHRERDPSTAQPLLIIESVNAGTDGGTTGTRWYPLSCNASGSAPLLAVGLCIAALCIVRRRHNRATVCTPVVAIENFMQPVVGLDPAHDREDHPPTL